MPIFNPAVRPVIKQGYDTAAQRIILQGYLPPTIQPGEPLLYVGQAAYYVSLGPFLSIMVNYSTSTVSGVILDLYNLGRDISNIPVGSSEMVLTTGADGLARGNIILDFSRDNLYYRATWPIGSYDSTRPTYIHQEVGPVFPKELR